MARSGATQAVEEETAGEAESANASPAPSSSSDESGGRFFEWRGHRVHYEVCGNEEDTPIVFLHGFGVGTFHFQAQLEELSKDHRVFALDFCGQGKSW